MYFDQPGKVNTRETLTAAFERARELGLDEVVLASTSGETAFMTRFWLWANQEPGLGGGWWANQA